MNNDDSKFVWIFTGAGGKFPGGVFLGKELALSWISEHKLTGILTKYPVNIGLYDWALRMGFFVPKRDDQREPEFIGKFTCASTEHYHFEDGVLG